MKKLLGISIVAMLAVTPMMANAEGQAIPATPQSGNTYYAAAAASEGTNKIATTSYVKGAYNAIQTELNGIATDIDVTTTEGHIDADDSVAENIVSLNSAVMANDAAIGVDTNGGSIITDLTGTNTTRWKEGQDHGNIVEAINTTKDQVNTVDSRVGQLSGLDSTFTDKSSVVGALNELKTATSNTDNKVVAVYSNWNNGLAPTRAGTDFVGLQSASALAGVDTGI